MGLKKLLVFKKYVLITHAGLKKMLCKDTNVYDGII